MNTVNPLIANLLSLHVRIAAGGTIAAPKPAVFKSTFPFDPTRHTVFVGRVLKKVDPKPNPVTVEK